MIYKIAVLDDDELWCQVVQRFFRNTFEVFILSNATFLLEEIEKEPKRYDLIIVDLSLPPHQYKEIDGRKLIQHLRKVLSSPPLLVLVTAFIGKNELDAGEIVCEEADAFLAKDAGLDAISQRLQQLLNYQQDTIAERMKFNQRVRW